MKWLLDTYFIKTLRIHFNWNNKSEKGETLKVQGSAGSGYKEQVQRYNRFYPNINTFDKHKKKLSIVIWEAVLNVTIVFNAPCQIEHWH